MSQLKIYKASAGSGKTFRLAIEYMKLILTSETNYRHILAVTFTNKATAEMKSRIIGELFNLSTGKNSKYLEVLAQELNWQEFRIMQKAKIALKNILHDYSRFSISTIDSFFQKVIKAFNRELGINSAYNVELDESEILDEAVDNMIKSIEDNPKLLEWLHEFASEKIREGNGWNLKKDITRLGKEIYNESFRTLDESIYEKINNRDFLKNYYSKLATLIAVYEKTIKKFGIEGLKLMEQAKVTADSFKSKNSGPAGSFQKMSAADYSPSATIKYASTDLSAWVTKTVKEPEKSKLLRLAENELMPKLFEAVSFIHDKKRAYITAKLIQKQLYTLGILVDLRKAVRDLCKEKGIVLISDSGHLLKSVIAGSETPFVYEKMGTRYNHFMIDEFQDTSGLQWNNFKPLLGNSLAENNFSLVVGDVKQAIYRWRSGDWRLLAGKLDNSFPEHGSSNQILNSNWRSYGKIIKFNNTFFKLAPDILQNYFETELIEAEVEQNPINFKISSIYADSKQEISKTDFADNGYVRLRLFEIRKDDKSLNFNISLDELIKSIKELQDKGVKANNIAILVNRKAEAAQIAELFLKEKKTEDGCMYNFEILSGESLFITKSEVVLLIISILNSYLNPDDLIEKARINFLYHNKIMPRLEAENLNRKNNNKIKFDFTETSGSIAPAIDEKTNQFLLDFNAPEKQIKQTYKPELNEIFEDFNNAGNEFIKYLESSDFQELISGKPIIEIIYGIAEKFNLFSLGDELAYLQAFIDQISIFEKNHSSEISGFIDWWDENGDKFTIPISEKIEAISVITIHKSKGLEFEHVLIPFFDWKIEPESSPDKAPLLWCVPEFEPFNELELVPVRYKKDLGNSIFYREYFEERFNSYIDNLNLAYVALTRAKKSLWIWSEYGKSLNSVGFLLKSIIMDEKIAFTENLKIDDSELKFFNFPDNSAVIEIGNLSVDNKNDEEINNQAKDIKLNSFEFTDFRKLLKIKKRGEDFFTHQNEKFNGINKGKLIHEVLSLIQNKNDLQKAINKIEADGKITAIQAEEFKTDITEMLDDKEVSKWFDGSYRVLNERNILTGVNGIKRPDRIMTCKNETIVVDYKSGETESDKYKKQLKTYIELLEKCGFNNVKGYIWYTRSNKRVQV